MKAFHNDKEIKKKYLARVKAHQKADEIIKGQYWKKGKGCAVGCTIHNSDHKAYETELGVPEWLARVEDTFFENLPNEKAMLWPAQFLEAINVGADLNKIKAPFMIYILEQALENFDHEKYPDVVTAIEHVSDLWTIDPEQTDDEAWSAARSAAWSAPTAESTAWSAAESAAWSAARSAAESAAESAAWSAARSTARPAAFIKYSEVLLELMRSCVPTQPKER
jgi:hypothetical protein